MQRLHSTASSREQIRRTKLGDGGVAIGGAGLQIFDAQGRLVEHRGPGTATEREQLCAALGA